MSNKITAAEALFEQYKDRYCEAYKKVNNKEVDKLYYKRGWVYLNKLNIRLDSFVNSCLNLELRLENQTNLDIISDQWFDEVVGNQNEHKALFDLITDPKVVAAIHEFKSAIKDSAQKEFFTNQAKNHLFDGV